MVSYKAIFSVVTQRALRDDTKDGFVATTVARRLCEREIR